MEYLKTKESEKQIPSLRGKVENIDQFFFLEAVIFLVASRAA